MRVAVCSRSFCSNSLLRETLLRKYPHAYFNDSGKALTGDELALFLSNADKAIVALEKISREILAAAPELRVVSKYGVGLDNIDLGALKDRGVHLGWKGGVNASSVAELTLFFVLGALRGAFQANRSVINGEWTQHKGSMLEGKKVGIVGLGHVGKRLVQLLQPFDVKICVNDLLPDWDFITKHQLQFLGLDEIVSESDVISIHVSKNRSTYQLFGTELFTKMKKGVSIINTSRGDVINEDALINAMESGKVRSAAVDVMCLEPFENKKLISLPNFFCTPHIGGSSFEAIQMMGLQSINGLDDFFQLSQEFINQHS